MPDFIFFFSFCQIFLERALITVQYVVLGVE